MGPGERAVVFGRAAEVYDRVRPSYPEEAIHHIVSMTDVTAAVEVGAGTGKATRRFAHPGRSILCLEPDPGMAAVLVARELPGVEVVVARFEEWAGPDRPVDLIYAAQAWHWVDRDIGYNRALGMLRPHGVLALMWNVPVDRYGPFTEVYRDHAPQLLAEQDDRIRRRDSETWLEELAAAGFHEVGMFTHHWEVSLDAGDTRLLYSTYSDHMLLEPSVRRRLLDALEAHVTGLGGTMLHRYRTQVFTGRAALSSPP
jgi:SAM-dependent methyltransferase